jgi:hypothetical protein
MERQCTEIKTLMGVRCVSGHGNFGASCIDIHGDMFVDISMLDDLSGIDTQDLCEKKLSVGSMYVSTREGGFSFIHGVSTREITYSSI